MLNKNILNKNILRVDLTVLPLRVVHNQAILFLKLMSERGGSDIYTLKLNDEFLDDVTQIQSRSMSDPPPSDICFKNKMAWV